MLRKLNAADWVTGFINYLLPFFITLRLCLSAAVCRRNKNQELRELESRKQRAAVREFYTARFFSLLPATIRWIKDALINCASTPRGENLLGMAQLIEMGRLLGGVSAAERIISICTPEPVKEWKLLQEAFARQACKKQFHLY
jgi:hypothetical protein